MDLEKYIISENRSILEALKKIDSNAKGIVFVCEEGRLLGVITDGDIRRYILKNGQLNASVKEVANYSPYFVFEKDENDEKKVTPNANITAIPIIDEKHRLLKVIFSDSKSARVYPRLGLPVAIMAGGKGSRLKPYTDILPKPLIPIGNKTIIEHIMEKFETFSCTQFDLILNYKKNLIKAYFMDCTDKRDVSFVEETEFLGTGGGLKLLAGHYDTTFFLSNCDILVDADYSAIYEYHKKSGNIATMVCAMKQVEIPYGTVILKENGAVAELKEKPSFSFMTNTGLYVLEPRFLDFIPEGTFIHITDVIQKCIDSGENVGAYPISEQAWMDMGQFEELEKMKQRV